MNSIKLDPKNIDVWCTFYDQIIDKSLLQEYNACLSPEETQRLHRFYFDKDKHRFLVTRALVRNVLSRYATIPPSEWQFSTNAFGMPRIDNCLDDCLNTTQQISFNISHTAGLIVLTVTTERAIGVDVENSKKRAAPLEVADKFFSTSECADLGNVPTELQQERFFQYWTLKESYIKARGMGLSIPLNKFSFDLTQEASISLTIAPELNDNAMNWLFWQYVLCADHTISLCAQNHEVGPPQISFSKIVPLADESALLPHLIRQSNS